MQDKKDESVRAGIRFDKDMREQDERIRKATADATLTEETLKEFQKFAPIREEAARLQNTLLKVRIEGQQVQNRITKIQAERAANEIAVIGALNREMAEDQYLLDNYYPLYVQSQTNHSARGNRTSSTGTRSPQEWLNTLPRAIRNKLLSDNDYLTEYEYKEYIGTEKQTTHNRFSYEYATKERYQNLYYKKCNKSKLSPITTGFYGVASDDAGSVGVSAFGFGLNAQ